MRQSLTVAGLLASPAQAWVSRQVEARAVTFRLDVDALAIR